MNNKVQEKVILEHRTLENRGCLNPLDPLVQVQSVESPEKKCFRSSTDKIEPHCFIPKKLHEICNYCESSWILYRKKMSLMKNNRRSAKYSKARKVNHLETLKLEAISNRIKYQTALRIHSELTEEIRRVENDIKFTKFEIFIGNGMK